MRNGESFLLLGRMVGSLWGNLVRLLEASIRSRTTLVAEILFLRNQPARSRERHVKPRRASDGLRAPKIGMLPIRQIPRNICVASYVSENHRRQRGAGCRDTFVSQKC
jgi:hypothetical protein